MRVVATSQGYDGLTVRDIDEEFDMPDGSKATWFKPVEAAAPAVVEEPEADGEPDVAVETPRRGRPPKAR